MTFELIISPEAEAEMGEAFDWYEEQLPGLGSDFLLNVDAALQTILRNPKQFPCVYKHLRQTLIRRFPYQIFFLLEKSKIVVLAVFHARRSPKRWLERANKLS